LSNKKPKTTKAQQKRSAHAVIAKQPVRTRKPTDAEVAFASPVPTMPANAGNAPNRGSDPHATREAEKYEHPIPSRELIMDVLTQAGVPMMEDEIAAALEISEAEIDGFTRRLNAMERDGQVMKNRRGAIGLSEKMDLIAGRVQGHPDGFGFLVPDDKSEDLFLGPKQMQKVLDGDRVLVREIGVDRRGRREASIIEILEHKNTRVVGRLFEEHDLPYEWSDEILALEKKLPKKVTAKECEGRRDLRALPFVTIDGETAKDFDDAVYAEKQGKGYKLYVAIADVSHYVKQGNAIDREARLRGNSVYFPRRVIPMLPEALSNEMCSLNPRVDRLALVCEMQISAQGEVKRYDFYEAVFHSQQRLTYTKVAKYLYENETVYANEHGIEEKLLPHIRHLDEVFQILLAARHKRGAIDFESSETEMRFTEDGKISEIVPSKRNDAHRLIEECMLAANVSTANFLIEHEHPALYRVHEGPNEEKLAQVRGMLKDFGLSLGGGNDPSPSDYAALIVKIKGRPDEPLLNTVLLRSLRQAVYSPENVGHFGLSYEAYTHFTSPIRRYPDLLTHRAIKAILRNDVYDPKESWDALGQQCSMTERRADDATRDVVAWLKCYYMKDRLGETFAGTISSVTSFGIFVALDDVYVEGLVHISDLGQDYFKYDKDRHQIVGERTRKKYQLADRVNIKVVRVDIETSKIDFTLAAERIRSHAEIAAMDAPEYKPGLVSSAPKVAPALQTRQAGRASMAPTISSKLIEPPGAAPAATKKIVMTVSSANPPTTPLAGLDLGKPESRYAKAGRQTKSANAPKPIAPKAKKPSAGKSPAALSPSGVKPKGGAKAGARKSNAKSRQKS
jgi:ribonuclease R